jgi:hypothetical protein
MRLAPRTLGTGEMHTASQQQLAQAVPRTHEILAHIVTRSREIPDRLVGRRRGSDLGQ